MPDNKTGENDFRGTLEAELKGGGAEVEKEREEQNAQARRDRERDCNMDEQND